MAKSAFDRPNVIVLSRSKNVKETGLSSTGTLRVLLVVDLQKTFCEGGSLAVNGGNALARKVNALMATGLYDFIVVSQDFHPENHKSYAVNNGQNPFVMHEVNGLPQMMWTVHGCQTKVGYPSKRSEESRKQFPDESAEFHDDLNLNLVNFIVRKGMNTEIDSYSAFFDNGKKASPEVRAAHPKVKYGESTGLSAAIMEFAASLGITDRKNIHIDLVGIAYDYCVAWSAQDAAEEGFTARVIYDACASIAPPEATTKALRESCVSVVKSSTVFRQARRGKRTGKSA